MAEEGHTDNQEVLNSADDSAEGKTLAVEARTQDTSESSADEGNAAPVVANNNAQSDQASAIEDPAVLRKERRKRKQEAAKPRPEDLKWFVVNTHSGFESKAKKALEDRVRSMGLEDYFGEVRVPEETVVELVRGQKKTSTRKFLPGYMLVQMVMNRDTWHLVKETPKVSGFIGDEKDPSPLSLEEVDRIIKQEEEGAASPKAKMSFQEGETVKVIDGPFSDFNGTVEEVRPEKGKVKVLISIFGRATPVELDFIQVEKV